MLLRPGGGRPGKAARKRAMLLTSADEHAPKAPAISTAAQLSQHSASAMA